jgi:peptidoglycan/xylan/chitin deacetylase (PgdA/CDA1 family)
MSPMNPVPAAPARPPAAPRIVVFTGDLSFSVRKGIVQIDRTVPDANWLVVIHRPPKRAAQVARNQWRNLQRNGWRWIPYQASEVWQHLFARHRQSAMARNAPGEELSLASLRRNPRLRLLEVPDIHAPDALQTIRDFNPDLGIALAAPILRRPLFSLPAQGTVNLHKGKVPEYRGMPPAFWEFWNDEQQVGCTVHWVDDKLDTGAVAAQTLVPRDRYSTVRGMQLALDEVGVDLTASVARQILSGQPRAEPQRPHGTTHRKPTLAQVAALDRKMAARAPASQSGPKRLLKSGLAVGAQALCATGIYHALRPRITVLLYHRVTDSVRDNLSVGIEQFERQMALLRRHCRVLPLEEVLACRAIPRSRQPLVCVTFDDGYLDNFSNAVPVLVRHGIPAAFFISTGIVGSAQCFPHDTRRGNPPIANMQWEHLRSMRDQGFTIGSHTVNHVDLAGESEAAAWLELTRSRDDLQRELGLRDVILGYPYGGRQHMTPQRLDLVKQAGYAGCLSAYGGSNVGAVDPFDVRRRGIHWEFFDRAFLYECMGLS